MAKVLGAVRLSHDTDASTSVERQTESIEAWAKAHKHTVVKITTDTDTSGSIAPQDRDDLGRWLTDDALIRQWDVLVIAKLDRLSRSLIDFSALLQWCQERGKVIVSVAESLDFGAPTGKFVRQILILFAEFERQMMRDRRADAARKLYSNAGYNGGGSLSWGYRAVRQNGRIDLVPDEDMKTLIGDIADAVLAGDSVKTVADRYGLDHASLLRRLRKPSLKGVVTLHGEVVRDTEGLAKLREPVIEPKKWARLQARLDANSKGAGVPRDASPWLHVLKCWGCGEDLYLQRYSSRPNRYYNHKPLKRYKKAGIDPCNVSINGWAVEEQITPLVLQAFAGQHIPEVINLPAEDHSDELAAVDEAIAAWEEKAVAGESPDSVIRILDGLHRKREAVAALPAEPARREVVMSPDLFTARWQSLETDRERGDLLRGMGMKIYVSKDERGKVRLSLRQKSPGTKSK